MKSRNSPGNSSDLRRQPSPADISSSEAMDVMDKEDKATKSDRGSMTSSKEKLKDSRTPWVPASVLTEDGDLTGDPRSRTSSLDLHQRQFAKNALEKLLQVFRNPSASFPSLDHPRHGGKEKSRKHSTSSSGRSGSPLTKSRSAESSVGGGAQQSGQPKRRFMRVVRDAEAPPPEQLDDNPHTISRYTQEYLSQHYSQKSSEDEPKPYTTTGHTILKKSSGSGGELTSSPASEHGESCSPSIHSKRATFFGEVEVIEYGLKDKVVKQPHATHTTPIRFDDDSSSVDGPAWAANSAVDVAASAVDVAASAVDVAASAVDVAASAVDVAASAVKTHRLSTDSGDVDKREVDYRIEGATVRVTFNNPPPGEEEEESPVSSEEPLEENKENMDVWDVASESKAEAKLKTSVSSSSFNNIFSPIGEVIPKSEVSRLENSDKRTNPAEVESRTKSVKLMGSTTATSLLERSAFFNELSDVAASSSNSFPRLTLLSSSSPASLAQSNSNQSSTVLESLGGSTPAIASGPSPSPPTSPRGSLCALQNYDRMRRRTEEDCTMAV